MGQNFIELHNDKADFIEFLCKVYFLRIPVQYVVLFTQSYIEKYKELNEGGDNLLLHAVKHSYIYDAERKSMIIGGNGR
jgi:hypothetical protein